MFSVFNIIGILNYLLILAIWTSAQVDCGELLPEFLNMALICATKLENLLVCAKINCETDKCKVRNIYFFIHIASKEVSQLIFFIFCIKLGNGKMSEADSREMKWLSAREATSRAVTEHHRLHSADVHRNHRLIWITPHTLINTYIGVFYKSLCLCNALILHKQNVVLDRSSGETNWIEMKRNPWESIGKQKTIRLTLVTIDKCRSVPLSLLFCPSLPGY